MTLRAPLSLLEEGREGGSVLVGSGGCLTTSACCHACKHFICIDLMELQRCMNVPLKTSPLILGRNNNVMGNTGTHSTVWQHKVGLVQNSLLWL